jgi:hypothetical protein
MAKGKKTGGRQLGTENKVSRDIKEAYRLLLEDNIGNMNAWLKKIAKKNPEKALQLMISMSEFVLPKLQRTTIKDERKETVIRVIRA